MFRKIGITALVIFACILIMIWRKETEIPFMNDGRVQWDQGLAKVKCQSLIHILQTLIVIVSGCCVSKQ